MNSIKENFVIILLVFLILITVLGFGGYIYIISQEDNNGGNTEVLESELSINNYINDINKEQENNEDINELINNEEKNIQNNNSILDEITKKFNNCNVSQKLGLQGYMTNAVAIENKILVYTSGNGISFNVEFILDNNILYAKMINGEEDSKISAIKLLLAIILADSVGQVKGYPEGLLCVDLLDEAARNYTIENEGIEIKQLDNGEIIIVSIDLKSSFPFLNKY